MVSSAMQHTSFSGFHFRQRQERIDWRRLAAIDVDSVARNLDFQTLQENIMNVTFCNIESEIDTRNVDPNFLKLFKLSQLTIEYLLHSQDYLSGVVTALEEKIEKTNQELSEREGKAEKLQSELHDVKRESHKRKKMLIAQQQIMHAGANSYHKCPYCPKAFISESFLQSHIVRRHEDSAQPAKQAEPTNFGASQGQIQKVNTELENELVLLKKQFSKTENQLEEMKRRNRQFQEEAEQKERDKKREMESWKREQIDDRKKELDKIKEYYGGQLREMTSKYENAEKNLDKVRKKSSLGNKLEDDDDDDDDENRQLKKQVAMNNAMRADLEKKIEELNEKWANKFDETKKEYERKISGLERAREATPQVIEKRIEKRETQLKPNAAYRNDEIQTFDKPTPSPREKKNVQGNRNSDYYDNDSEDDEDEDDDDDENADENETTAADYKNTLNATSASGITGFGTGSLTSTMSQRVEEKLKTDTQLLKRTKDVIIGVLSDKLRQMGINEREKTGITDEELKEKQSFLNYSRRKLQKDRPNLLQIRQEISNLLESLTEDRTPQQTTLPPVFKSINKINRLKLLQLPFIDLFRYENLDSSILVDCKKRKNCLLTTLKESFGFLNPKPLPLFDGIRSGIKKAPWHYKLDKKNRSRNANASPSSTLPADAGRTEFSKPRPAPRASSPPHRTPSPQKPSTRISQDSLGTTQTFSESYSYTRTSSNFDSYSYTGDSDESEDEESDYTDDDDDGKAFGHQVPDPDSVAVRNVSRQPQRQSQPQRQPQPQPQRQPQNQAVRQPQRQPQNQPKAQKPKEEDYDDWDDDGISELQEKIPASTKGKKPNLSEDSGSDLDNITPASSDYDFDTPRQPKRPTTRTSTHTDNSNNTLQTSQWGGSSKAYDDAYDDSDAV
ncbi:DgyrCDS6986 [Dimorphilus gyrociliatus]|uniref:DgyrCDS6986 n=1 Tax=Dimorphilus gyrociliatus TaxID=2664684 RepID=A0A7I8VRA2_9ANNE|nr:DgyrCDS6986 [Dimorphilus gyrociliatus]